MPINRAVGPGQPNDPEDVRTVQSRLGVHQSWLRGMTLPAPTGTFDDATARAILHFQQSAGALLKGDGIVSARGFTIRRLDTSRIPHPAHRVFSDVCWATGSPLTVPDFEAAARRLKCETAAIRAVAQVETKRDPFDEFGRPTILFERHYFSRLSGGLFNQTHSDISNASQGGYGLYRAQYDKLKRAATLDEAAALKSASWGMFQIMGANHAAAGHETVAGFVDAMIGSQVAHLNAFVAFVAANHSMLVALRNKAWADFARRYNGPGYRDNNYDVAMSNAYNTLSRQP